MTRRVTGVCIGVIVVIAISAYCFAQTLNPSQAATEGIRPGMARSQVVEMLYVLYDEYPLGQFSETDAGTSIEDQYDRARNRILPEGGQEEYYNPAARFLTERDQLDAYNIAIQLHSQRGSPSSGAISFSMDRFVGEGFTRFAFEYRITSNVTAVFRVGRMYTLFPKTDTFLKE